MALIYAGLGTMDFARMAQLLTSRVAANPALLLPGVILIVTGIGFKLRWCPSTCGPRTFMKALRLR